MIVYYGKLSLLWKRSFPIIIFVYMKFQCFQEIQNFSLKGKVFEHFLRNSCKKARKRCMQDQALCPKLILIAKYREKNVLI